MGKHHLRNDKTCLNCNYVVENRYCPNCGQENIESRKTFHHLFLHFFEDLTHYENAFWKTIKNLAFKPGALTSQYLSGKRMSYLAPVRLYIFISFVTFFLLSVLPGAEDNVDVKPSTKINVTDTVTVVTPLTGKITKSTITKEESGNEIQIGDYNSVKELDSIQNARPLPLKHGAFAYWLERNLAKIRDKSRNDNQFREKFKEAIFHNIPKALFLYMPFFALALWLFHGKKRWYYFDHGIFTLHYFSFMLFTFSIMLLINGINDYVHSDVTDTISDFASFVILCWWFFYFFRSHRRFYGESRLISGLKGLCLFFINLFFILIFVVGLMMFSAITIK